MAGRRRRRMATSRSDQYPWVSVLDDKPRWRNLFALLGKYDDSGNKIATPMEANDTDCVSTKSDFLNGENLEKMLEKYEDSDNKIATSMVANDTAKSDFSNGESIEKLIKESEDSDQNKIPTEVGNPWHRSDFSNEETFKKVLLLQTQVDALQQRLLDAQREIRDLKKQLNERAIKRLTNEEDIPGRVDRFEAELSKTVGKFFAITLKRSLR